MKIITNIKIEKAVYGGYGLGYNNGKTIFIWLGIPGDIADIVVTDEKKNHSFAEIEKIIEPSVDRIDSVCANFGTCGGCSYLNVEYETEIIIKKNALLDNLKRIAGLDDVSIDKVSEEMEIVTDERFNYRSHATIKSHNRKAGFYKKGTNEHVPFGKDGCILLNGKLNEFIIGSSFEEKETRIAIDVNSNIYSRDNQGAFFEERESGIVFQRGISDFFQVNKFLRSEMIKIVSDFASLRKDEKFVDFGCGVGFFSIPLGKIASKGIGVDLNKASIQWGKKNCQLNDVDNVKFYKQAISDFNKFDFEPEVVVVDPPRAGVSKKGRKTIVAVQPERIVYVSCNPSTFSRDLKDFMKEGYRLKKIKMIDMFPCTHHIELISLLFKENK